MVQPSTQSERQSKQETKSNSNPDARTSEMSVAVHRIDEPRNQGGRWMSGAPMTRVPVESAANVTSTVRLDRLVRQGSVHMDSTAAPNCIRETTFEQSVKSLLANERWRSQLRNLSQMLQDAARSDWLTVSIVSLADELDAARAVLALAMLHGETGSEALVVDGDRHRRTLSILLQHNHAAGLWDAVPAGKPVRALSIPLATRNVSFVPAGNRTLTDGSLHLSRCLTTDRGSVRLMLMDAGVFPGPDIPAYLPVSDLVYAVVRCGNTQRKNYLDLVGLLRQSGKSLAGCIVSGTFE